MEYHLYFHQVFKKTLLKAGYSFNVKNDCLVTHSTETGWQLNLPELTRDILVLNCAMDYMLVKDGQVSELETIEKKYGANSNRVLLMYCNPGLDQIYSGPINLIEFNIQNYHWANTLRDRWNEWKHVVEQPRTMAWQCLNGLPHPHRRRAVEVLRNWPNGILTFGNDIPLPNHSYKVKPENDIDNFMKLNYVYGTCAVNIVTETVYNNAPGHISEKTTFALATEQIPIVIGYSGIVQHCRDLGFDMFDDLVDTSYDNLPNEVRVEQAILLNQDLIQGRIDLSPYRKRLQAQREFLLNDFARIGESKFIRDCENLASELNLQ